MKSRLRWMLITLLLLGVIPTSAFARPAWQVVKTDHFTVFYPPELERSAFAALQTLEHFRPFVEALVGNEDYHLPVVIEDTGSANGFTNPVFRRVNLWATPSAPRSTLASAPNWWSTVAPHEYIHHLSLSRVGGEVRQFRTVLGSLALPNLYAPGWVIEGITGKVRGVLRRQRLVARLPAQLRRSRLRPRSGGQASLRQAFPQAVGRVARP